MIVPMKKVFLITQTKDADACLKKLRQLGVLHLEHQNPPQGAGLAAIHEDLTLINNALNILNQERPSLRLAAEDKEIKDWKFLCHHIADLRRRILQLEEYGRSLNNNIALWKEWGDFAPEEISRLGEKKLFIRLYRIPAKEIDKLPQGAIVRRVSASLGMINCAVISQEPVEVPFKELELPALGLSKMQERLERDLKTMEMLKKEISNLACDYDKLTAVKKDLEKDREFQEALAGMGQRQGLAYLAGFIPHDKADKLNEAAKKQRWAFLLKEPTEEDNIPVLIRNPTWVSIIKPVFKLLEILPGYRELDISPLFLCFLSLFFGMIIGDAGYGALYFFAALIIQRIRRRKITEQKIFFLIYTFSACAIFWGLLTGTVFGHEWYLKAGGKPLLPILNNTKFLQAFCFFLGAFHLSLAHAWQAIRKAPALTALADCGWICVLWAAFFLAKTLILNDPLPSFLRALIITGITLVIFCSSPQKNLFKTIASGLGAVSLSLVNNFTDVVSYIRLFAVGLAGIAISDTVNILAGDFFIASPVICGLIIFLGHTINIILGPLSVLVHGIRLNVLEFSSHASLSWSGQAYKPLQE